MYLDVKTIQHNTKEQAVFYCGGIWGKFSLAWKIETQLLFGIISLYIALNTEFLDTDFIK